MSKWNLERFTGGRRAVEMEEGATKGATVGVDLFYNGVLVRWEDIYNGGATPETPSLSITDWTLILNIPPRVTALANQAGTGIYVLTAGNTSAVRQITSADGSVTITNPAGQAGDINLSVPVPDTAVPYFVPAGQNYTVAANKQALWKLPISLGLGASLTILGALEQVT